MTRVSEKITTFLPWTEIESEAQQQILNTAKLPFLFKWVAVMPDCHYGKGATVGTVMATQGAIVPAAVGVDIGCGMIALETSLKAGELGALHALRESIERRIPMSAGRNNRKIARTAEPRIAELKKIESQTGANYSGFDRDWEAALGTLGGGNHFIEICVDEPGPGFMTKPGEKNGTVWLTLHSGSRGVGNKIGNRYIRLAQDLCKKKGIELPDRDLAYLSEGTEEFANYVRDLRWAQAFARLNREEMMDRVLEEVTLHVSRETSRAAGHAAPGQTEDRALEVRRINCHHNFTQIERHFGRDVWITRKGAIEARVGMHGMIPGSMGTRSYIVSGLGNEAAFCSAPHGAGRRMSRTKARAAHTMRDLETAMQGIEFRRSSVLLDEIPSAYKDIDHVMECARELIRVERTLKQIVNCKGD